MSQEITRTAQLSVTLCRQIILTTRLIEKTIVGKIVKLEVIVWVFCCIPYQRFCIKFKAKKGDEMEVFSL